MKRKVLLLLSLASFTGLGVVSTQLLRGQAALRLHKVPAGNVAAHLVGRLIQINSEFEILGYLSFAEGFPGPLFAGTPSERTARISFRSERFRLNAIPNGTAFHVSRLAPADGSVTAINLYYNPQPSRDFANPDTFSDGQFFGVIRPRGSQGILVPGFMFHVQGSLIVERLDDLVVDQQIISLRRIVDGLNITFSGTPPSMTEFLANSLRSVPVSATVVSVKDVSNAE